MSEKRENISEKTANRVLYITVGVILVVMAVIVAATAAQGKRNDPPAITTADTASPLNTKKPINTAPPVTTDKDSGTTQPDSGKETAAPADTTAPVSNPLPSFRTPIASGKITKPHSIAVLTYSLTMNDYRTHTGIDIACEPGASVLSPADGVIKEIWQDPMMGWCISIAHEGSSLSVMKNLSAESLEGLKTGDAVQAGEQVALVGDTALLECAEVPHLHYELYVNDKAEDPSEYLTGTVMADIE